MRRQLWPAMVLLTTLVTADSYADPLPETQCVNNVFQQIFSGDHKFKAVSFERRCGGISSGFNVSVLEAARALPNEPGNVLVEEVPSSPPDGEMRINIVWDRPRHLRIEHSPSIKLKTAATNANGVTIEHTTEFRGGI